LFLNNRNKSKIPSYISNVFLDKRFFFEDKDKKMKSKIGNRNENILNYLAL